MQRNSHLADWCKPVRAATSTAQQLRVFAADTGLQSATDVKGAGANHWHGCERTFTGQSSDRNCMLVRSATFEEDTKQEPRRQNRASGEPSGNNSDTDLWTLLEPA